MWTVAEMINDLLNSGVKPNDTVINEDVCIKSNVIFFRKKIFEIRRLSKFTLERIPRNDRRSLVNNTDEKTV